MKIENDLAILPSHDKGKVYIPKDNKLRVEIIRLYHNMPVGRHGRQ